MNGLLPIFQRDFMIPIVAVEAYYYLGFINTEQRFAFEAMEKRIVIPALFPWNKVEAQVQLIPDCGMNGRQTNLLISDVKLPYSMWSMKTSAIFIRKELKEPVTAYDILKLDDQHLALA